MFRFSLVLWYFDNYCGVSLINLTSQIHASNFMLKLRRPTNYCGVSLVNLTPANPCFKFHAKFKTAHKLLWRFLSQCVLSKKKPNLRLVSLCLCRFVSHWWLAAPACKPRRSCHMKPCRWSPSCNQVSMINMSWLTHVENPSKEQNHNKVKSVHSQIFKRPYPH